MTIDEHITDLAAEHPAATVIVSRSGRSGKWGVAISDGASLDLAVRDAETADEALVGIKVAIENRNAATILNSVRDEIANTPVPERGPLYARLQGLLNRP